MQSKNETTQPGHHLAASLPGSQRSNYLKFAIVFSFWTLFSVLYANQIYFEMLHKPGMHHSWVRIAIWQLLVWYCWGWLSPLILMLGRRFPLDGSRWLRGLLIHFVVALVLAALHVATEISLKMLIRPFDVWSDEYPFLTQYQVSLKTFFLFDVLIYWAILGFGYALEYRERYRLREVQASQLKAQLAQAQLESLKTQLHPHFLFNTLNTIAGLVRSNQSRQAVDMIVGLSTLLRHALESANEQQVRLRDEVKFIELYLAIQKVRFSDKLSVRLNLSPQTLNALVPNLILQPLVENAIRHGLSTKESGGLIVIEAHADEDKLHLSVHDDGPGVPSGWRLQDSEGIGLANTSERLKHLYGSEHQFALINGILGGVTVSITLPFLEATV